MLDLKELVKDLTIKGWHRGEKDSEPDNAVVSAISDREGSAPDREKSVVTWLNRYRVLMGLSTDTRTLIAKQIIQFADGRKIGSLQLDKAKILSEFERLQDRISAVIPTNKAGKTRAVISLTSKALWCCYPDDVPIFDRNAFYALAVISRLCHLGPTKDQSEYAQFLDVWFQVFREVEAEIDQADLSDCPHKVRALDRILWYLGQNSFYDELPKS